MRDRKNKRTISQARQPMKQGHSDDKSKEIVDEGIDGLVRERSPRHVRDRLQFVIYEQLGGHHHKSCVAIYE